MKELSTYQKIINGELVMIPVPYNSNKQSFIASKIIELIVSYDKHSRNMKRHSIKELLENELLGSHVNHNPGSFTANDFIFITDVAENYICGSDEKFYKRVRLSYGLNKIFEMRYCLYDKKNNKVLVSENNIEFRSFEIDFSD